MAALTSTFIVRLLDKVTSPAKAVGRSLGGITDAARRTGRAGDMLGGLQNAIERNNHALDRMRGRMLDVVAGAGILAGAVAAPINAAMALEDKMADIAKVSGMSGEELGKFEKFLRNLSKKEIPMAVEQLGELAASASQSGIDNSELEEFTRLVGKSAVAWDMAGGEAGESLAKIKTALGLTVKEAGNYADVINYLSDSTASSASDLVEFSRRVATDGKIAGFTNEEVLALGAAMISTGAEADVAATSLRNAGRMLSRGEDAAKRQRQAFEDLGMSAEDVAKAMPTDASGTMLKVLEAISKSPAHKKLSLMSRIFGDEARALMPLLSELEKTEESLKAVADKTNYLGSVQKEFETRSKTGRYALQRFKNQVRDVGIVIGKALLPGMKDLLETLSPYILAIADAAEKHPKLVAAIAATFGGLVVLRLGFIGVQTATLLARGGLLNMILPFAKVTKWARKAAAANIAYQGTLAVMGGTNLTGMGKFTAGLKGIALAVPGVSLLGPAFAAIGAVIAGITAPVALAVAGIALLAVGGAALIYRYWQPIKAFFTGLFSGLMAGVAPIAAAFRAAFQPIIDIVGPVVVPLFNKVVGAIRAFLVPISAADARTKSWGEAGVKAGKFIATAIDWALTPLRTMISLLVQAAVKIEQLKAKAAGGFNWLTGGMFGGGDKTPAAPAKGKPAVAGARAAGGPVSAGQTYLVGEQGPELWTAPRSGSIIPNGETMAAMRAFFSGGGQRAAPKAATALSIPISITFNGVTDKEEMLRQFGERLASEAASALRGLHADTGMA